MNASCPTQTRDARPALLLLAIVSLLLVSLATVHSLSRLDLQELNLSIPALKAASPAGPAILARRPPEPPAGGGTRFAATATPAPTSPASGRSLAPLPTALPVATPPESR